MKSEKQVPVKQANPSQPTHLTRNTWTLKGPVPRKGLLFLNQATFFQIPFTLIPQHMASLHCLPVHSIL